MTTPTQRPTLSSEAADLLCWIASEQKGPQPKSLGDSLSRLSAVRELYANGLTDHDGTIREAGREEAARLEEEGARRKGEQAPPPPATPTVGGAIVGFIAQILMVPEGRKVAAGLIDSALDHLNRNREESRRVAEEKPAPAPATTERRAPKKGRRRRG